MKPVNVGANPLSRFIILFTLAILIMTLFTTIPAAPASAEPAEACTRWIMDKYAWGSGGGWDKFVLYKCTCTSLGTEWLCVWIEVGDVNSTHASILTYYQETKCNLSTGNIASPGAALVASAIATSGNKSGINCGQAYNAQRARLILQRWNGGFYATCVDTGFVYGSTTGGLIVNRSWGSAPCGAGTYRAYSGGWTLVNGVYQGGYVATPGIAA